MAYFVHVRRGDQISLDPDKIEFPDEYSAREEALALAREMLAEAIRASTDDMADSLIITDGEGREITAISLHAVLPKTLRDR